MLRSLLRGLALVVTVIFLLLRKYQKHSIKHDIVTYPPLGQLVDIEARKLHLWLQGEGNVTVVFDSGLGQTGLIWSLVIQKLHFARLCVVDRAGYGWSSPGPYPRTSLQVVQELHTALQNGNIPGPYILVGHSWGGMNMLLFASLYPNEVAGLVLVDAYNADVYTRKHNLFHHYMSSLRRTFRYAAIAGSIGLLRLLVQIGVTSILPEFITKQPQDVRQSLLVGYLNGQNFFTAIAENAVIETSAAQIRDLQSTLDIPLVVLTHGQPSMFVSLTKLDAEIAEETWQHSQADMATRSSRGRLIIAKESGHDIHVDQPDLVVQAIQIVMNESTSEIQNA